MKVGDTVYVVSLSQRRGDDTSPRPAVVRKIGRTYFYLEHSQTKYSRDTLRDVSEYSGRYQVFLSLELYEQEDTRQKLASKISLHLATYGRVERLDLGTLQQLSTLLKL